MRQLAIVIPALNPLPSFVGFVEELLCIAYKVVVIDDGSDDKYKQVFHELQMFENCIVLHHATNQGKGSALKTAFSYISNNQLSANSILTVGAHGQHTLIDIKYMIEAAKVFSDGIILGVRRLHSREMPTLSFIGNRAATILFEMLFHKRLFDIQSGLRMIPKKDLLWLIKVPGEKFNYDLNMLVGAIERKIPIYEVPIGYARLKKNSLMHYDEIINTGEMLQQIWRLFVKNKKAK